MKETDRAHFVQRFKFDIEIERKEDATRLQNDLFRLFQYKISRIMDRILTEFDVPQFVARIPRLELDLGEIPEAYFEKEFLIQFERMFRREIRERMADLSYPGGVVPRDRGEMVALAPARLEILSHFLSSGRLPLGGEKYSGQVEALLDEMLDSNPDGVRRMLQILARSAPASLRRLSTSFSERAVKRIYQVAVGTSSGAVAAYEKKTAEQVAKATGGSERMIRLELRQQIMAYLFVAPPSSFRIQKLHEYTGERMLKKHGEKVSKVFESVLGRKAADVAEEEGRDEVRLTAAAVEVLAAAFKGQVPLGSIAVVDAWEYLVVHNIAALRGLLLPRVAEAGGMAMLAELFSASMLRDFVEKAVPAASMRLIEVAASVVSAQALYGLDRSQIEAVTQVAYSALVRSVVEAGGTAPSVAEVVAKIEQELRKMSKPPEGLLADWEDYQFATTARKADAIKAEREAEEAESKAQKVSPRRKLTPEERRRIQAELAALAEAERNRTRSEEEIRRERDRIRKAYSEEFEELAPLDDASFFKQGADAERKLEQGTQWDGYEELGQLEPNQAEEGLFKSPSLDTDEGKVEFLMVYLATGQVPWWARRVNAVQVEMLLKQAFTRAPEQMREAVLRLAKQLPVTRRLSLAARIIQLLEPRTLEAVMPALIGEVGGFATTISLLLSDLLSSPPVSMPATASLPQAPDARKAFIWISQLFYAFSYVGGEANPKQLLRFVLRETAKTLGLSPRAMIEVAEAATKARVAAGERRFAPVQAMLPKSFEGLEMPIASAVEESLEATVFQRALKDTSVPEQREAQEVQGRPNLDPNEMEGPRPEVEEQGITERPTSRPIGAEETPDQESREGEPIEAGREDSKEEDAPKEQEVPKTKAEEDIDWRAKLQRVYGGGGQQEGPSEEAPLGMPLSKEEEEEWGVTDAWRLEVLQHYLSHGSLSPTATAIYTPQRLREELRALLSVVAPGTGHMLRGLIRQRGARMRLFAMGPEMVLLVMRQVNAPAADRAQRFVEELAEIFAEGGSPLGWEHVMDHALRYLSQSSANFVPMQYVRDFFAYVARQPGSTTKEVLSWTQQRLERRSSEVQSTLLDILDVMARIEQSQKQRRPKTTGGPDALPKTVAKPFDDEIYVSNAGIGILQLHLVHIFKLTELITADRKEFVGRQEKVRAIHFIQYMCYKEIDSPEEKMVMAKVLTGWPLNDPVDPLERPLDKDDIELCEGIWTALVNQWAVMKSAGPEYARTKFVLRNGRLKRLNDGWTLKVEESGLDILKRKIPWPTNPIRLPWNTFIIEVEWD